MARIGLMLTAVCAALIGFQGCVTEKEPEKFHSTDISTPAPNEAATPALRYQDGCSSPLIAGLIVQVITGTNLYTTFRDACNFHDDCYHHSLATYNKDRGYCEDTFYTKMLQACNKLTCVFDSLGRPKPGLCPRIECQNATNFVSAGTRTQGEKYFHQPVCKEGQAINSATDNINIPCSTYEISPLISINPAIPDRVAFVTTDNRLYAKDGALASTLQELHSSARSVSLSGFRIGISDPNGTIWSKEGALSHVWINLHGGIRQFTMNTPTSENRIGAILNDGTLKVKEGGLHGAWITLIGGVSDFKLFGKRVGALTTDGTLRVKEGTLNAAWSTQIGGVRSFQLIGNRIGALTTDGILRVKDGGLNAAWVVQSGTYASFQLSGNRIGALRSDGTLWVKEGGLSAAWTNQMSGVKTFQIQGNRIAVITTDGALRVKEGTLNAAWVVQIEKVKSFQLQGNRIGALTTDGLLRVKEGSLNAAWVIMSGSVEQFAISSISTWPN